LLEEIWYLINAFESPWGFDNSILFKIYSDASSDDYECPTVVTSKEHKSCGQSRFGCWTCTVVKEDKSMSSLIENGQDWMKPLLKFRNELQQDRNKSKNRESTRRNGQLAINEDGMNQGNYTTEYRYNMLKKLLMIQKEVQIEKPLFNLITNQELIAIQVIWNRDNYFDKSVSNLYEEIYGDDIYSNNFKTISSLEKSILREECKEDKAMYKLIENLIAVQQTKSLLVSNYGLNNDLEKVLESQIDQLVDED
jgi:DNA sulfur modification protein DndC